MTEKIDFLSLLPEEIGTYLASLGEPRYRAKQIFDWCRRGTPIGAMSNLPATLRKKLAETCEWRLPTVAVKQTSALDGTVKYLFRLIDGNCVESVLMRYHHGTTLCISSEVGCPMGCKFCASTIGGKVRNLTPSEMLGQVIAASLDAGERIDGVVLMGIGEPLDNYDNVMSFAPRRAPRGAEHRLSAHLPLDLRHRAAHLRSGAGGSADHPLRLAPCRDRRGTQCHHAGESPLPRRRTAPCLCRLFPDDRPAYFL